MIYRASSTTAVFKIRRYHLYSIMQFYSFSKRPATDFFHQTSFPLLVAKPPRVFLTMSFYYFQISPSGKRKNQSNNQLDDVKSILAASLLVIVNSEYSGLKVYPDSEGVTI